MITNQMFKYLIFFLCTCVSLLSENSVILRYKGEDYSLGKIIGIDDSVVAKTIVRNETKKLVDMGGSSYLPAIGPSVEPLSKLSVNDFFYYQLNSLVDTFVLNKAFDLFISENPVFDEYIKSNKIREKIIESALAYAQERVAIEYALSFDNGNDKSYFEVLMNNRRKDLGLPVDNIADIEYKMITRAKDNILLSSELFPVFIDGNVSVWLLDCFNRSLFYKSMAHAYDMNYKSIKDLSGFVHNNYSIIEFRIRDGGDVMSIIDAIEDIYMEYLSIAGIDEMNVRDFYVKLKSNPLLSEFLVATGSGSSHGFFLQQKLDLDKKKLDTLLNNGKMLPVKGSDDRYLMIFKMMDGLDVSFTDFKPGMPVFSSAQRILIMPYVERVLNEMEILDDNIKVPDALAISTSPYDVMAVFKYW
jgi:hypothetical protein